MSRVLGPGNGGVPSAARRLSRHLRVLLGLVIAIALAVSMAGFERVSVVRVTETIDSRWRGSYDLLVRGDGQRHSLEGTLGLVEPNFLAFAGEGGLSLDDVAAIEAIEGVEVAAPVATVGMISSALPQALVWVDRAQLPEEPTEYRIRWTANVHDGAVARVLAEDVTHAVLRVTDPATLESPVNVRGGTTSSSTETGVIFEIGSLPELHHLLVAVDPLAEARLLGAQAPAGLELLAAADGEQRTLTTYDAGPLSGEFVAERLRLLSQQDAVERGERRDGPVVPVIVAERLPAAVSLTVEVEQGATRAELPPDATWTPQTESWSAIGLRELDLTERVRPFTTPEITAVWPGSDGPEDEEVLTGPPAALRLQLVGRPDYTASGPLDRDAPRFAVTAGPLVATAGTVAVDAEAAPLAHERAYRPLAQVAPGDVSSQPVLVPIGRLAPVPPDPDGQVRDHAPLGIYGSLAADRVDGTEAVLQPTLNARGLLTPAPVAMTDLVAASELRGERPVDAVRVRVGGIETYDSDAVARVEGVASRIRSLGFDVDVVAGASLQPVEIEAAGYLPDGGGVVVEQPWTTLGAASRVEQELGSAGQVLRLLGLVAALVLVPILQVTALQLRAGERVQLHQLGWSRWQVSRWFLREALLAGAIVMAVGAGVVATGWAPWESAWPVLPIAGAFPLSAWLWLRVTASSSGRRRQSSRGASLRQPSVAGVMWREFAADPLRPALRALAITLAASAIGAATVVLGSLAGRAGPSDLARASLQASGSSYLAMLAAIAIGAATVIVVLAALDGSARRGQRRLLVAIGFEPARLNRHARLRELALGLTAAAVALWLVGRVATAAETITSTSTIAATVFTALVASLASSHVGRTT